MTNSNTIQSQPVTTIDPAINSTNPSMQSQGQNPVTATSQENYQTKLLVTSLVIIFLVLLAIAIYIIFGDSFNKSTSSSAIPSPVPSRTISENGLTPEISVTTTVRPTETIVVDGDEWSSFEYNLPVGNGRITGFAPSSHTFGIDSSTNSVLGNTINFTFDHIGGNDPSNVSIQFIVTEGFYLYYETPLTLISQEKGLYRYEADDIFYYTDDYKTEIECLDFNINHNQPNSVAQNSCGAGTYNSVYILQCEFDGDKKLAQTMCDEFVKRFEFVE